ncbi:MAG: YdbH domain-containing protein [Kiritimatiellae bacterium]|nr:YdbH domain-containing protein [Kiritimatiellia bacterium]
MKKLASIFFGVFLFLFLTAVSIWSFRIPISESVARRILKQKQLDAFRFRIENLSPSRLTLRHLAIGEDAYLDRIDLRYNLWEAIRSWRAETLSVSGSVARAVVLPDGKIEFPALSHFPRTETPATNEAAEPARFPVIAGGRLQDLSVRLETPEGKEITRVEGSVGFLAANQGAYTVQTMLSIPHLLTIYLDGKANPVEQSAEFYPVISLPNIDGLLEFLPAFALPPVPVATSNLAVRARGWLKACAKPPQGESPLSLVLDANMTRPSVISIPQQDTVVRLRSAKTELTGCLTNLTAKCSFGFNGIRWKDQLDETDSRRLFNLMATVHWTLTPTGQVIHATTSSELPARASAKLMPRLVPFIPSFFSEGGTLATEIDLAEEKSPGTVASNLWNGSVFAKANVQRSSFPSEHGMMGAKSVEFDTRLALYHSAPSNLHTEIRLTDAFLFQKSLAAHCDLNAELECVAPFDRATGTFCGTLRESRTKMLEQFSLPDDAIPFRGIADVTLNTETGTLWKVTAEIPDSKLSVTQATAQVRATAGATLSAVYSDKDPALTHVHGEAHLTDVQGTFGDPKAAPVATLQNLRFLFPLEWSPATGLSFPQQPTFDWDECSAQGLKIRPDPVLVETSATNLSLRTGIRLADSALSLQLQTSVPLSNPQATELQIEIPETTITNGDATLKMALAKLPELELKIQTSLHASLRMYGTRPYLTGNLRLQNGDVKQGTMTVNGISAEIPFGYGVLFRTQGRPYFAFTNAVAGNLQFDDGRVEFQVTPQELFIDRALVSWCNGSLNFYSAHIDWKKPQEVFDFYADRIDMGKAITPFIPFPAQMNGILYGRIPIGYENGKIHLNKGFLYSMPKQGGALKINNPDDLAEYLESAGIAGDVQSPLAKALSDMDFDVLKFDLTPSATNPDDSTLSIKIGGKSNYKQWPAPIDLTLNFHGPISELINFGIELNSKKRQ